MFIQTCRRIARNPGVPTLQGWAKHSIWHLAKRVSPLPLRVPLTSQSSLQLHRRSELNGCVALAWSQGLYDYNNMNFIREVTAKDLARVCMDVGSNVGPYALIMSEQPETQVYCFEPHPQTFAALKRVLQSNDRKQVRTFNLALSDTAGELRFSDVDCNPCNHVLSANDQGRSISVLAMPGLQFCVRENIVPDLLKIDTEGHEPAVLQGFGDILNQTKVVILEENAAPDTVAKYLPPETFTGPLYVDFDARKLSGQKVWEEDAVYINRRAIGELERLGFRVENIPSAC